MKTKIYWAQASNDNKNDWNILYKTPALLFSDLQKKRSPTINKSKNLFLCPAVRNLTSRIAVLKCPLTSHYMIENNSIKPISQNHLKVTVQHEPNLENSILFVLSTSYIFFCEEDVEMTLTAPFFSKSPHLQYGAIVPGTFNISKWFRSINIEVNLWENVNEFKIKEGEAMAYLTFDTPHEIEFVRFDYTERLQRVSETCGSASLWEKLVPLLKRYNRFKDGQLKQVVLKEIKNNIID